MIDLSNAADKSKSTKAAMDPLSNAMRMSLCTFSSAVSVECCFRYAD